MSFIQEAVPPPQVLKHHIYFEDIDYVFIFF